MIMPSTSFLTTSLTLVAGLCAGASADTIMVCTDGSCDFTDPSAAIASALPGDVVEIGAGTSEIRRMLVGREMMGAMA